MIRENVIYQMDCFDFLSKISRESIDLAVIDPPYNLKKADWDSFKTQQDFLNFSYKWIDALLPTLKPNAGLYIFNTPLNCAFLAIYLQSKGLNFRNWITWDKRDGFAGGARRFVPMQESIVYFSNGPSPYFDADAVRIPYASESRIEHAKRKGILKNGKRWFPNENGKLCTDVWHVVSERHKTKRNGRIIKPAHVTPKPVELIERIILSSSKPGDAILDCFSGTGTTAFVSKKHGRRFYACDSNLDFVIQSKQRLMACQ